jgi:hypothetical protein
MSWQQAVQIVNLLHDIKNLLVVISCALSALASIAFYTAWRGND